MAGRILLRGAALGLAAATASSLHALSRYSPSWYINPVTPELKYVLTESALGLQASVLGVRPLSGVHLADVRARAEQDLACADAEDGGDPAEATDLRLLLALLATRDGRADDAMRLYEEAARDSPFDPRPRALAFHLCILARRSKDETVSWGAAYRRLVPELPGSTPRLPGLESHETRELVLELIIAATLGGVLRLAYPESRAIVMAMGCGAVDKGLAVALQDEARSTAEKLQLRVLRVFLYAKMRQVIKEEGKHMATAHSAPRRS